MPQSSSLVAATPQDALRILQHLDAGLVSVNCWLKTLHSLFICDDASNSGDITDDPSRCNLSRWFHDDTIPELRQNRMFQKAGKLHKTMHDMAHALLQKKTSHLPVTVKEYDKFMDIATALKDVLHNLQFDIINNVCVVDQLTGAWNRHAMHSKLAQELERMTRNRQSCSICMLDIDKFKNVNDSLGHIAGDQVLQAVVQFITGRLRKYDSIFRYGGEEFLLCLPNTTDTEAEPILNRLRANLEKFVIPLHDGKTISVTASFGVTVMSANKSLEETIAMADHALLSAKINGRNRVCIWKV